MCVGVAVPSAVERKELQRFPVVKEVASEINGLIVNMCSLLNAVSVFFYRKCHPSSINYLVTFSS